jgi:predicted DNA-binding transcriptional regulator YafY
MRADRLLSILLLLQARGRMTAQELAGEVEVSQRTIYRDVEALSMAGVPVYADRGPGGGFALLDRYHTTLTGLSQDEVRVLFMLNVPKPLTQLGVDGELRAALLKLSAALPEARRPEETMVRQRFHLDSNWWFQGEEPVPHLPTLQKAVWQDRRLHLTVRLWLDTRAEWLVDPYGLVAKAGVWYLVCARDGNRRVQRVSDVLAARLADERFARPADFDLSAFWKGWCADHEGSRPTYPVVARVSPNLVPYLPLVFGDPIREAIAQAGPPDAEGWLTLSLPFETFEAARMRILGLGRAVEVLAPPALRKSVVDFAAQIVDFYSHRAASGR